ncbi:hypothetical protein E1211_25775 [Micromonospora sp. 15K316]|uniref:hypothetical protein n=1 Tax=Micromonospora sp. 15K316 TaxID=2530376 RepID=UPI0010480CA8|nr:hypothetical protein [Micromonospora sp. 15K316]TDC29568.1 hypothetical protein E1211_25775 [Micromonospora sp. 15K316]
MSPRYAPLVPADELASPQSYRQLRRPRESADFRREVEGLVAAACREQEAGDRLAEAFVTMSANLAGEGALSFTGLLPAPRFGKAREAYDSVMRDKGSRGSLHSYLNAAQSSLLLDDPHFRETFAHPLLVALVAHALGGPVKIVDLRAKDTQPLDVVARDNTLHVDNNPFMDEFKVIVTWTSGTERGPSGQGLTYLPRTNRLFRQCHVGPHGDPWSDEDSCIFPSRSRVDEALAAQARFHDDRLPRVVHLKDLAAPCHTIFAASRLVHHRYRTSTGAPRSAIMASFHRTDDGSDQLGVGDLAANELDRWLLTGAAGPGFLAALRGEATRIVGALRLSVSRPGLVIDPDRHLLEGAGLDGWYARLSAGVSLNRLREAALAGSRDGDVPAAERLVARLQYDLQGPLNMPLYADLSEEERKRARIVIREMAPDRIRHFLTRLRADWVRQGAPGHVDRPFDRSVEELHGCLRVLDRSMARAQPSGHVDLVWGPADGQRVARSLHRFVVDLGRTAERTEDEDSLVTASAFGALAAALAADLLVLGTPGREVAARLFALYAGLVAPDALDRETDAA